MILMDVMMPGIGGLEATRRIRQAAGSRWLPILMVTALAREDEVLEGVRAGADDYVTKPFRRLVRNSTYRSIRLHRKRNGSGFI